MSVRVAAGGKLTIGGSQLLTTGVAGVATEVWVGVAVVFPAVGLLPLGLIAGGLLIVSPAFRLGFILLGGMLVLNTTQDFNLPKVVYLLGVGLGVAGASLGVLRSSASKTKTEFRMLVGTGLLFSAIVGASLLVSAVNGTSATQSLR